LLLCGLVHIASRGRMRRACPGTTDFLRVVGPVLTAKTCRHPLRVRLNYNRISRAGEMLSKGLRMKRKASADATRCVHSGEDRHGQAAPLTTPIAQTAVFVLPDVKALRRYAEGDRDFYLYSRYGNPTVAAAEEKVAALEGAEAAVATSSGMAAELVAALITCRAGDEIVSM